MITGGANQDAVITPLQAALPVRPRTLDRRSSKTLNNSACMQNVFVILISRHAEANALRRLSSALDASPCRLCGWFCASALKNRILWVISKTLNCDHEMGCSQRHEITTKLYCDVGNDLEFIKKLGPVGSRSRVASLWSYKSHTPPRTSPPQPHFTFPSHRLLTSTNICEYEKQWLLSTLRHLKRCWAPFDGRWFSARSSLVRSAILPSLPVNHVGTVEP